MVSRHADIPNSGAGLIVSSARDYARWVKSQLEESGPLSRAAHAALREPKMTEGPGRGAWDSPPNYASGWDVVSYKGHRVSSHNGLVLGFGTTVFFLPNDGFGVVTAGNTAIGAAAAGEVLLGSLLTTDWRCPRRKVLRGKRSFCPSMVSLEWLSNGLILRWENVDEGTNNKP